MKLQNISIMGEGCISSGSYNSVKVMGEGKILGDIEVGSMSIMGELESESSLKVGSLSVMGEGEFATVEAQKISVMGTMKVEKTLRADYLKIMGTVEVKENIKAEEIEILGYLEGKELESEILNSRGSFDLESMNANDIRVKLAGPCNVAEMGGETIRVQYPRIKKLFMDMLDILLFRKTKRADLRAETIEADEIYLENTVAKSVKGNRIIIGTGCKITNIEYRDHLYIDQDSVVENSVQR